MRFVYIAGKYTGTTHDWRSYFEIEQNINAALAVARELAELGYGFFCPHQHSAHFEVIAPNVQPAYWYELDNHFLESCDAVLMLPGWEQSKGATAERNLALEQGIPVFYTVGELLQIYPPEG